jgi:predicted metal-dependent HD superfamily phosphohydrolase
MSPLQSMRDRWLGHLEISVEQAAVAVGLFDDLVCRYAEPGRYYHTLDHIGAVLDLIESMEAKPSRALLLAGWLHDVIYNSRAKDNEEQSALYALEHTGRLGIPDPERERIAHLIRRTRSHDREPGDHEAEVLIDADLAILGSASTEYDRYAAAIRREYAWVSDADYRVGRRSVLEKFLSRPCIFFTPLMRTRFETNARANIGREIASLTGQEV